MRMLKTLAATISFVAFVTGVLVTLAALLEDNAITSWNALFAGLLLLVVSGVFVLSALVAHVAETQGNRDGSAQPLPPIDPARRPYGG
jgi:hypothetical protein